MATIQIRDVPEETYETLRLRAKAAGQSLQAYMRQLVIDMAGKPTKQDVVERIKELQRRAPVSWTAEEIVEAIHSERR